MRQIPREEEEMPISPGPNSSAPGIFSSKKIFFLNSSCSGSRRSEIPHIETEYCRRDEVSRRLFHHNRDLCDCDCDCDCASDGCGGCIRRNKQCFFKFFVLGLSIALVLLLFGSLSYNLTRNKDADESFDLEETKWVSHRHEYSTQSGGNVSASVKIEPVLDVPVPLYEHPEDYDSDEDLRGLQYHLDVQPDRIEPIPIQHLEDSANPQSGVLIIYDGREPPRMKRSISFRSKTKESDLSELEKPKRDTDSESHEFLFEELNGVEEGMKKFWESYFKKGKTIFEPFSLTTPSHSTPMQNDEYSEEEKIEDELKNMFLSQHAIESFNPVTSRKVDTVTVDATSLLNNLISEQTREETTTEILTSDGSFGDTTEKEVNVAYTSDTDFTTLEIDATTDDVAKESNTSMQAVSAELRMDSVNGREFRTWPLFQFSLPFSGLFGSSPQDRIIPDSTPLDTVKGISLADAKKIKKEKRKHLLLNSRVVGGSSDVRLPTGPDISKPFVNAFETLKTNQQLSFTPSATSQFVLPYQMCLFAGPFPGFKPSAHGIQPRTFSFGLPPLLPSVFDKTPQPSKSPFQVPAQQNILSFSINNYPNGPPRQPFQPSGGAFYNFPNQQQVPPPNKQPIFCTYLQPPLFQFPTVPGTADFSHAKCVDCQGEKDVNFAKEIAFPSGRETICADDKISCLDGSCIPLGYWCDNQVHCKDASDEAYCSCRERVSKDRLCDGYVDCPHGEDETGCFDCPKSAFSCGSFVSPGSCIPLSKRCDGVRDCATGADELDCSALFFHVRQNNSYHVSQVTGYLHRNWKGDWFPVCVEITDNVWAKEACAEELGDMNGNVEVRFAPVSEHYKGPFLVREEEGIVALQDHCKGHVSTFVTCPPMSCGTRVEFYNLARSYIQDDKDIIVKRSINEKELNKEANSSRLRREETGRVVGGRESEPKAWPWAIAVYKNGAFHCGGVILDENWVLTAAHCMEQYWKHYYEVRGGMLRRFSYSAMEQARTVSHVIIHENYDLAIMNNDLALLRVKEPFHFNRWVRPACLPVLQDGVSKFVSGPAPGTRCTAVGWGALRERGIDPDQLREVEIPIMSRCKHKEDLVGEEICAGKLEGGKDTCQGDSGGPLLCRDSGSPASWYVAGIVSHGEGCARPGEPGAYTRISLFVDWITANTNDFQLPSVKPLQNCPGFRCRSASKLCIPRKWVCNGYTDCLEAEDEKNCSDSAAILNRKYSAEDKFFGEGDVEREKFEGVPKSAGDHSSLHWREFETTEKFLGEALSASVGIRTTESAESTTVTYNDFVKKNAMKDKTADWVEVTTKISVTTEGLEKGTEKQERTSYKEVSDRGGKTENVNFEEKYNKENKWGSKEKENVSEDESLTTEGIVAREEEESKPTGKITVGISYERTNSDENKKSVSFGKKYNEKVTIIPLREKTTEGSSWKHEEKKFLRGETATARVVAESAERKEVTTEGVTMGTEVSNEESASIQRSWEQEKEEKLSTDEVITKGVVAKTEDITTERVLGETESDRKENTRKEGSWVYEVEKKQSAQEVVIGKIEKKEEVTTERDVTRTEEEEESKSMEEITDKIAGKKTGILRENVEEGITESEGEKINKESTWKREEITTEVVARAKEESKSVEEKQPSQEVVAKIVEKEEVTTEIVVMRTEEESRSIEEVMVWSGNGIPEGLTGNLEKDNTEFETEKTNAWKHEEITTVKAQETEEEVTNKRFVAQMEESNSTERIRMMMKDHNEYDENTENLEEKYTENDEKTTKDSGSEKTSEENFWKTEEKEKLPGERITTERIVTRAEITVERVVEPTESQFYKYLRVTERPDHESTNEESKNDSDETVTFIEDLKKHITKSERKQTSTKEISTESVVPPAEKQEIRFYKYEDVTGSEVLKERSWKDDSVRTEGVNGEFYSRVTDSFGDEKTEEDREKIRTAEEIMEEEKTSIVFEQTTRIPVWEETQLLAKAEEVTETKPELTTKITQIHSIRTRETPDVEEYSTSSFGSSTAFQSADFTIDDRLDSNYFQCRQIVQSILPTYRCDGEEDCEDGSDEENCTCVQVFRNSNPEYLCDGRVHCPDGSDEKNCSKCRQNEFYCEKSKECISSFERCDGMSDCAFGEDEAKCLSLGETPERLMTEGVMMINSNGAWKVACQEESAPFGAGDAINVCSAVGTVGYERYENRSSGSNCTGFHVTCAKSLSRSVERYKAKNGSYLWPWNGSVYSDGRIVCSGVLLRPRWLLVSSHCLQNVSFSKNYLTAKFEDDTIIRIDGAQSIPESSAVLLHLSQEVIPTESVRPLGVPYIFESDPEKDVCIAVGDRTVFLKIQKHCQRNTRCYKKMTATPTGCTSKPWMGVIVCQSRFGWYPSSTFSEKLGYCGFERANFTNLQENFRNVMDKNVHVFPEPVCDGFRCPQGVCIPRDRMCDGRPDCSGKEDESFGVCASKKQTKECKITEMKCRNGRCIPKVLFGDGVKDCEDESDEPANITCVEYLRVTAPERICDGKRNCYDKTDEDYDLCSCDEFKFQCKLSGYCIPKDFVCDGEKDCPGGEDEEQCMGRKIVKNLKAHLEVMQKSYGIWHTMCPSQMSKQRSDTFCRDLGFKEALFTYSRNQTVILPQTDPFSWVKLNQKTSIGMRGNKPFVRLVTFRKTCDSVKCA